MRILLTTDFLSEKQDAIDWHSERILKIIQMCIKEKHIVDIYPKQHFADKIFNPDIFYINSNINPNDRFVRVVDRNEIDDNSCSYLNSFIENYDLIIGYELQELTKKLFDEYDKKWINIWLHPVRFLEDELFAVETSKNFGDRNRLNKFHVNESKFFINAEYIKIILKNRKIIPEIKKDGLVIFGQTRGDKTLRGQRGILTLRNYKNQIVSLMKKFDCTYFVPHPLDKNDEELKEFISNLGDITILNNSNGYALLASNNVEMVVSISSSICTEAFYFGKNALLFNKPTVDIKGGNFVNIDSSLLSRKFWRYILDGDIDDYNEGNDLPRGNSVRNILNANYSYDIFR